MAINEEKERIVTGKKLRRFVGGEYPWERISFWHKASDCEMDNENNLEDEIQDIKDTIQDTAVYYARCITSSYVADKCAYCSDKFILRDGIRIIINFIESNTAESPTLNINNTGAKPISVHGDTTLSTKIGKGMYEFVYYNYKYELVGELMSPVIDNLESTISNISLSANMGRILGNYAKTQPIYPLIFSVIYDSENESETFSCPLSYSRASNPELFELMDHFSKHKKEKNFKFYNFLVKIMVYKSSKDYYGKSSLIWGFYNVDASTTSNYSIIKNVMTVGNNTSGVSATLDDVECPNYINFTIKKGFAAQINVYVNF